MIKRTCGWVAGMLAAMLLPAMASAQETPGCEAAAWSPEVLQVFGDAEAIHKKLERFDATMALDGRRVFLVIIEDDAGAKVAFFERDAKNEKLRNVTTWKTAEAKEFTASLQKTLHARKGKGCAGVMARDLMTQQADGDLKADKPLEGKATAAGAVKHLAPAGGAEGGKYQSVTVVILC